MKIDERKISPDVGALVSRPLIETVLGTLDVVRPERVNTLRAALATGAYRPEPSAVARSLLRELLGELLV